ncbi:hypothetical protein BD414DRAFT_535395 [Trametes punicea]|nr:hypothetical protein BD414DRAFT_535395 [Trametes punicea]
MVTARHRLPKYATPSSTLLPPPEARSSSIAHAVRSESESEPARVHACSRLTRRSEPASRVHSALCTLHLPPATCHPRPSTWVMVMRLSYPASASSSLYRVAPGAAFPVCAHLRISSSRHQPRLGFAPPSSLLPHRTAIHSSQVHYTVPARPSILKPPVRTRAINAMQCNALPSYRCPSVHHARIASSLHFGTQASAGRIRQHNVPSRIAIAARMCSISTDLPEEAPPAADSPPCIWCARRARPSWEVGPRAILGNHTVRVLLLVVRTYYIDASSGGAPGLDPSPGLLITRSALVPGSLAHNGADLLRARTLVVLDPSHPARAAASRTPIPMAHTHSA